MTFTRPYRLALVFLLVATAGCDFGSNSSPTAPDQTSLPNTAAPPASATQTTGQTSTDPKVQEMNQREKDKVERQGK